MTERYNQFIAGGGLGGLLSAALLSQKGQRSFLVEKLLFFGGRFTSLQHHGFEVPTGAIHLIPHSRNGPLGLMLLHELNLPLKIVDNEDFTVWYWSNRKQIRRRKFWGILKAFPRMNQRFFVLRKLLLSARHSERHSESFHEYLEARTEDPQIFSFFNPITGFALSIDISQLTTAAIFRLFKRMYQKGHPGVPVGGRKAVTAALVDYSRRNGSTLKKNCELIKIEMDGSLIESAVCRDRKTN